MTSEDRAKQDRVRDAYDAVARDYDRNIADELNGKPLDRELLEAFVELVADGTIADVGCGPGRAPIRRWSTQAGARTRSSSVVRR